MTRIQTTSCQEHGHPEFSIEFSSDTWPIVDAQELLHFLESSVAEGTVYSDGETVQVGWMESLIRTREDGTLSLQEPDMTSMPIHWIDSIQNTLVHLRLQKDVADSLSLLDQIDFPSYRQGCLVGVDLESASDSIIMERTEGTGMDSGWFVGNAATQIDYNDANNLKRISLYELALSHPQLIMFFALPAHSMLTVAEGCLQVTHKGIALTPNKDSFLDVKLRRLGSTGEAP